MSSCCLCSSSLLSSDSFITRRTKPTSISWSYSINQINCHNIYFQNSSISTLKKDYNSPFVVHAAWTRRSRSEAEKKPNRKSWKQRTDMYMRPFLLNIFFSKRFVHAKVMHRGTSKVISVATTNAKDLRNTLPSLTDDDSCRVIGKLIAERSKESDVFAMSYEPKKVSGSRGSLVLFLILLRRMELYLFDFSPLGLGGQMILLYNSNPIPKSNC